MTSVRLPLFPLNSVLFPGLVLPLNVFEARYRALMRDLLALPEDERRFGVVAIRDGREVAPSAPGLPDSTAMPVGGPGAGFGPDPISAFHTVGCVADAATIREKSGTPGSAPASDEDADAEAAGTAPGGGPEAPGYEVLATGTTRFKLLSVDASGPYLMGEVEELPEVEGEGAGALASGVVRAFRTYQKRLAWANERTLAGGQDLPAEPSVLSYLVAAAAVLDIPAKQRLLEAPDNAARLTQELELLRRETAVIGKLPSLPAVDLTRHPTSPN
ncbi:ATP-dependent protease [Streptomyces albofaciens JCM 4342]|uniref:LON peptidase substrate-binding domain-containing protein n=1 Tax=Streptomyces albofaciens TaxID=66866 RepID=UPI00123C66EE|nr:LON peptidase substrate-binding domain-containing protein [Streptomyces albofaciens]KAA6222438.1 ATP-dependent protease [Streptomyces albofaciens JCM 4342]